MRNIAESIQRLHGRKMRFTMSEFYKRFGDFWNRKKEPNTSMDDFAEECFKKHKLDLNALEY